MIVIKSYFFPVRKLNNHISIQNMIVLNNMKKLIMIYM